MRKSLKITLLLVLVLGGFQTASYAFTNPPEPTIIAEKLGVSGRKQGDQAAVVMLVRSSHSSANSVTINSGDAIVYDTVSDDGITVRHTTTSADSAFCGIAVTAILSSDATSGTTAQDDAGRRNWGYVLLHGKTVATVTAGGTNGNGVGDFFITSTDAGAVTTVVNRTATLPVTAAGVQVIGARGGFFYDAGDTSSTTVEVQVDKM